MRELDHAWSSQDGPRITAAYRECERMLGTLPDEPRSPDSATEKNVTDPLAIERARLLLWRGRLLVTSAQPEAIVAGLRSLDQAISRLKALGDADAQTLNDLSTAWMNRGAGLFRLVSPEALRESVRSYDEAIAVLQRNPDHRASIPLGAAWMNRGVGLMHLCENETADSPAVLTERLAAADDSLGNAISQLTGIAETGQPAARRNLASAWANLGLLRARRKDPAGAFAAHRQSVELFRASIGGDAPETLDLATRLLNLAQAAGATGETDAALAAGREARLLAESVESTLPHASELSLRARHTICVALGGQLARSSTPTPEQAARQQEAFQLVDEGLGKLNANANASPEEQATGTRLFEFGAWLYLAKQPEKLGAWLSAHLGDDPDRARIAEEAVRRARQSILQRGFDDASHGGMTGMLDILQSLAPVEERLKARAG